MTMTTLRRNHALAPWAVVFFTIFALAAAGALWSLTTANADSHDQTDIGVVRARIAGANRYETAALISQGSWPDGTGTVYIVSAGAFADALSAGTSIADGPLLLVDRDLPLPTATLDELERLNPAAVVALGGPAVISEEVLNEAAAVADDFSGGTRTGETQ